MREWGTRVQVARMKDENINGIESIVVTLFEWDIQAKEQRT